MKEREEKKIIGKGRSGKVYRRIDGDKDMAVKVFSGVDDLTKLVNVVLTGAPNAYAWSEDAVETAHLRRRILTVLLKLWFGDKVRIAESYGTAWDDDEKAYQISTEFIAGRPVNLHHPFSGKTDWEIKDITKNVMKPLQKKLAESGFDGLVWQAGKGNPIALNNFLLDKDDCWVWIDAESGVPALFPLNPLSLLVFYLPRSVKFKRALFDDVDIAKLKSYIKSNRDDLIDLIGEDSFILLWKQVGVLGEKQKNWKSISRIKKSILYHQKKELITNEQAEWYLDHQVAWMFKELGNFIRRGFVKVFYKLPVKLISKLLSIPLLQILKNSFRFLFNGNYRKKSVDDLLKKRITEWEERGQIRKKSSDFLRDQADKELTSPYLADFIILIGLKPLMNVVELVVLPAMYAAGLISEAVLVTGVAFGGIIYRTLYTLGRIGYERLALPADKRYPRWIALIIGMVPTFGNLAYPTQMVYAASSKSKELAEFLMFDISTRIGGKIPIWGGKDTLTEHFFNHIPDVVIRNRKAFGKRKRLRALKKERAEMV
jgi:hypothetical protein